MMGSGYRMKAKATKNIRRNDSEKNKKDSQQVKYAQAELAIENLAQIDKSVHFFIFLQKTVMVLM